MAHSVDAGRTHTHTHTRKERAENTCSIHCRPCAELPKPENCEEEVAKAMTECDAKLAELRAGKGERPPRGRRGGGCRGGAESTTCRTHAI